jgi:hypothetical protein
MTCDRVQAELSKAMDEQGTLCSETTAHLLTCGECGDFRASSTEISQEYATEVRAGIDRLRRLEGAVPPKKRRRLIRVLAPLAAAALLCWLGMGKSQGDPPSSPAPSVALMKAAPVRPALRVRLFEARSPFDDEVTFVLDLRPKLPLRLDQEFLPDRSDLSEIISLPRSLRF